MPGYVIDQYTEMFYAHPSLMGHPGVSGAFFV